MDKKAIWQDVQLLMRLRGLVIKKLPITLLRKPGGIPGELVKRAVKQIPEMCDGDEALEAECRKVLGGEVRGKAPNVYVALRAEETKAHGLGKIKFGPAVKVVGLAVTSTSKEDPRTALLECIAGATRYVQLAMTLYAAADTCMRMAGGGSRYSKLMHEQRAEYLPYRFEQVGFDWKGGDRWVLPCTKETCQGIQEVLVRQAPGLYDFCGHRKLALWPNCR